MTEKKTMESKWAPVPKKDAEGESISRPSLTYWQDAWRRLKKNYLSMLGLVAIILMTLFALLGPFFSQFTYSDQNLKLSNLPRTMEVYKFSDDYYLYAHPEFTLFSVSTDGKEINKLELDPANENLIARTKTYYFQDKEVVLDYHFAIEAARSGDRNAKTYEIQVNGKALTSPEKITNKLYVLGTDSLGRDMLVRLVYGARISLLIALIATLVQFFIGVLYGTISGYIGGRVDNIMMRIVDIIATIPLLLYVILLMVVFEPGLTTICIALGTVYWVRMARIVRGQILSIKEQEFVLAARTLGASTWRIMIRHLIPNALGPIIVSLAMMIPSAIFTESFLSFIGLGVNAPQASWGTLASDALGGIELYPYQLFYPSLLITITVLSFNFLGDGLRDALDPRLRK